MNPYDRLILARLRRKDPTLVSPRAQSFRNKKRYRRKNKYPTDRSKRWHQ